VRTHPRHVRARDRESGRIRTSNAFAALALMLLVAGCGSPTSSLKPAVSPVSSAQPSVAPSASIPASPVPTPASPPAIAWNLEAGHGAALRDPAGSSSLYGLASVNDGLFVVESDSHGATLWRATDSGTWTRLGTDRFALADVAGISAKSLGIVASGTEESGGFGTMFPTIWSSADGTAWSAPVVVGDQDRSITRVVELAGRLIAMVGGNGAPADIVSSTDGRSWTRGPALGFTVALPADLVANGTRLVAVGVAWPDQTDVAAAWYSDDGGTSWQSATVPPGGAPSWMTSVAVGPNGLVAVGWATGPGGGGSPAIWLSADGSDWTLVGSDPGPGLLAAIAHGADGWVAVGSNHTGGASGVPDPAPHLGLTAVSGNGRDWTFLAPEKDAQFTSVTATPGGWLAAGQRGPDAMLWTSGGATARFEGGWPAIAALSCPPRSAAIDLASLLAIPGAKRVACLGRAALSFRAWVVPQGGRGGTCGPPEDLIWLSCKLSVPPDAVAAHRMLFGPTLGVIPRRDAVIPASWGGALPPGTWVQVTGHFDDPAAARCGEAFSPGMGQGIDTPAEMVTWCRSQFVATRLAASP
jgi:hypothetical protein